MHDRLAHEALYRGGEAVERLGRVRLVVCGAGAVGSNLVTGLVRQGFRRVAVIDDDRVEAHNAGTQAYAEADAGAFKVEVLQAELFRAAAVEIEALRKRLTPANAARLLAGADLVVDGFDNHASRAAVADHCRAAGLPCLHVGLSAEYAEVLWNDGYRVPRDPPAGDVCAYPLARNLVQFAVALASEAIVRWALDGRREGYSFTLRDLRINLEGR